MGTDATSPEYREFRVTITAPDKLIINRGNIPLRPEPTIPMDRLGLKTIKVLGAHLAAGQVQTKDELVVLGSQLFKGLFDDNATRTLKEELDKIRKQKSTQLRLVLEFWPEARQLAELPWEYIYYPDDENENGKGFFIAADPESLLILARHVPLKIQDLEPSPQPLRILVVKSQPTQFPEGEKPLGEVVASLVIESIKKLADGNPEAIEFAQLLQPTKRTLQEKIRQYQPHVVHFLGHGKYDRKGFLALVKDDEQTVAWISDDELPDYFIPPPRLVFLHACEGAHTDSYDSFRGVALQLVYSRIPAVVAMQYEVENKVANRFALKFYQSLSQGKPIDAAVQDGRKELGMYLQDDDSFSSRAFGSPVVFLQSSDGIVKVQPAIAAPVLEETSKSSEGSPESVRCFSCNKSYVSARGFCSSCGAVYVACENCGQWALKGERFCGSCGSERKETKSPHRSPTQPTYEDSPGNLKLISGGPQRSWTKADEAL